MQRLAENCGMLVSTLLLASCMYGPDAPSTELHSIYGGGPTYRRVVYCTPSRTCIDTVVLSIRATRPLPCPCPCKGRAASRRLLYNMKREAGEMIGFRSVIYQLHGKLLSLCTLYTCDPALRQCSSGRHQQNQWCWCPECWHCRYYQCKT